ncbi:ATP-binding protein [Brucella pituitosa]|uniref:ATP-binding protein n=1 Tax=Brucella pituitosa TaxID=571256 RepID=UPI000C27173F|nr:ATP-binding protein [Brucella pituitosa]PJO48111.1 ATP-binding protein [Brucella pituitosa]
MSFPVIPQNLSISAMRSSGYRDTAHALAELIDNSVQSGLENGITSQVEIICLEEAQEDGARPRISKIGVIDNAGGMSAEVLRKALQFGNGTRLEKSKHTGIGKFGMGLPNSSISQATRVDVWSWQNGLVLWSYLDVVEIADGHLKEVPEPIPSTVPSEWLNLLLNPMSASGTLVVWSNLDRVSWKQSTTLLRHVEFMVGRVYRRFIKRNEVRLRLAAFSAVRGEYTSRWESFVRPNDPLYLMSGTNCPAPYDQVPAFVSYESSHKLSVGFRGGVHEVLIRASICTPEARAVGGNSDFGKHAKRNQGISVMRADRELELNKSFEIVDPRERWWGVEVEFPPALDDLFGVTNNKQAATGFQRLSVDDDAEVEGISPADYKRMLELEKDPRLPMYYISDEVEKFLTAMRAKIRKMKEGDSGTRKTDTLASKVEAAATQSVNKRRERIGDTGKSDRQEEEPEETRTQAMMASILEDGVDETAARAVAVDYVKSQKKFYIHHADISTPAMFDVASAGGIIKLTFNTRHEVHSKVFVEFQKDTDANPMAKQILSMMIAWARMEDEAGSDKLRANLEEVRQSWGRMAKDFFEPDEE